MAASGNTLALQVAHEQKPNNFISDINY